MTPNDIIFYYSGGGTAATSLGGGITGSAIPANPINNLFGNLDRTMTAKNDYVDYRCFYVANRNLTDTFYDAKIYIASERRGGSYINLGIPVQNEQQQITFAGPPNSSGWEGDDMVLGIDNNDVEIDYYYNVTKWQGDFQTKVRGIDNLQDVIIDVVGDIPDGVTFTLNYVGGACCRTFPLISAVDLSNLHNISVTKITEVQQGGPINATAVTVANGLYQPTGVLFSYPLAGNPVYLGNVRPGDYFPVWVQRITPKGTFAGLADNFVVMVDGNAV